MAIGGTFVDLSVISSDFHQYVPFGSVLSGKQFRNTCLQHGTKFSGAIDCFLKSTI